MKISNKDRSFLNAALKLSNESTFPIYRMGCIIVRSGAVISLGINRKSPGILKNPNYKDEGIHCELDSIISVDPKKFKGSICYVAGQSKCGNLIKSAPCKICEPVLRSLGVKRCYYFEKSGEISVAEY